MHSVIPKRHDMSISLWDYDMNPINQHQQCLHKRLRPCRWRNNAVLCVSVLARWKTIRDNAGRGRDWSAFIQLIQKSECFWCSRVKYWHLWMRHAMAAGKLVSDSGMARQVAYINLPVSFRLVLWQSLANDMFDDLQRQVTWWTGTCLSKTLEQLNNDRESARLHYLKAV